MTSQRDTRPQTVRLVSNAFPCGCAFIMGMTIKMLMVFAAQAFDLDDMDHHRSLPASSRT